MASEKELELYRSLTQSQQKYTYFLLAAAAGGIGLAVRATSTATLHWSLIPLAAAVLSWGVSFVQGCFHVMRTQSITFANSELLRVQSGEHPLTGTDLQRMQAAEQGIKAAIKSNEKRSGRHAKGQFLFLVIGAACFLAWHILGIVLRS